MSNVFLKNTTSASITVAGHKVYYIDSTDAELVEVEGTSRQALPSVGDTVTFGNYPQATSTPEPIEWTVLAVDSTNGKALLIAKKVLDCQKYNSTSASVTWETCSLRTWLNSTFFNAAFDSTEQGRVPLSHVETSGQSATDDNIFCISEQDAANTEYFANADARKSLGTQKAIDAGAWTYNGYSVWWLRSAGSTSSRAMIISTVGGIDDTGYSVNDTSGGVRPALWLNYTSTVKYNAFKFTLNNTPYYYVIDGTHDTWTDNLSAWGYSEVQPAPVLPEVVLVGDSTQDYWLYPSSSLSGSVTIAANGTHELYQSSGTFPGRSSYPQAMIVYQSTSGTNAGYTGFEPTEVQYSGVNVYGCKNISGGSLTLARIKIAKCYSLSATVVTVYNSSNVAYNAFKYTANNTDYYYVLDRTQTDWTDDLSSIGYALRAWTYNIRLDYGVSTKLLDSNGQEIQYDSSKTYTVVGLYGSNGNSIANASGYIQYSSIFGQDGVLYYKQIYGNTTIVSVRYTVS